MLLYTKYMVFYLLHNLFQEMEILSFPRSRTCRTSWRKLVRIMPRWVRSVKPWRKKRTGFQDLHSRSVTVRERLPDICRTNRLPRERKVSLNKNTAGRAFLLAVVICIYECVLIRDHQGTNRSPPSSYRLHSERCNGHNQAQSSLYLAYSRRNGNWPPSTYLPCLWLQT